MKVNKFPYILLIFESKIRDDPLEMLIIYLIYSLVKYFAFNTLKTNVPVI